MGRLTLQGALRFDYARSYFPDQQVGPTTFLPNPIAFPETTGVKGWKDISPRGGFAYDVFGSGKTSLKFNFGKYLEAASNDQSLYSVTNPTSRIAGSSALGAAPITRTWTDADGDRAVDCDLLEQRSAGFAPGRRRLLRPGVGPELRHGESQQRLRSGGPRGLGDSAE